MSYPNPNPQPEEPQPQSFPVLEPYDAPPTTANTAPTTDQPTFQTAPQQVFQPTTSVSPDPAFVPPVAAPQRKKTGVIIASTLAALFLATTGTFGVLYANEGDRNDKLTALLADKEKELNESADRLKDAQDEVTKAKDALESAENARKRAEDESASMADCRNAARALREAAIADDEVKGQEAAGRVFATC